MKGDLLIAHLCTTLPDSLSGRIALLRDALACIPAKNTRRDSLAKLAIQLDDHSRAIRHLQSELPLTFATPFTPPAPGAAPHNGGTKR